MQMNVQLHHVVTDAMTGETGMRIIRAVVAGERDPAPSSPPIVIGAAHASEAEIAAALAGNWREAACLCFSDRRWSFTTPTTPRSWSAICRDRGSLAASSKRLRPNPQYRLPPARHRDKTANAPAFDARAALHAVLGVDLTQIHGLGPSLALKPHR